MSPTSLTAGQTITPNFPNSFLYRTQEVLGGQASILGFGSAAFVGKTFAVFGSSLLAGFANQTVFNFTGRNPIQPTVQSVLPLQYIQPFLRDGGRAV